MTLTDYAADVMYNRILNMSALNDDKPTVPEAALEAINDLLHERKYDPLAEEEIMELFEMGASEEFVMMAKYDDGERNSARENADEALVYGRTTFGDFGTALWEGDMYEAVYHADKTNTRRLREIFGVEYLNAKVRHDTDSPTPDRGFKVNDQENLVFR